MTRTEPAAALPAPICPACLQRMPLQRSREVDVWICACGVHWFARRTLDLWMRRGSEPIRTRVPTLHHPRLWRLAKCDPPRTCPGCAAPRLQRFVGEGVDVRVCTGCRGLCVSAPALDTLAGVWRVRAQRIAGQGPATQWAWGLLDMLLVVLRLA